MECQFDSGQSHHAGVAQLVEHYLAKVDVVGSNPIARSISGSVAESGLLQQS